MEDITEATSKKRKFKTRTQQKDNSCSNKEISKRDYPLVFKFAIVGLLTFDVFIFYYSNINIRLYCLVMFFVLLNGWATSENEVFDYCDLYLLIDALCFGLYLIMLLGLKDGNILDFWLLSSITFALYLIWNILLARRGDVDSETQKSLRAYNVCNIIAMIYTGFTYLILMFVKNAEFSILAQFTGGILWLFLLGKWYFDNYFKTFTPKETVNNGH